ncbi:Gfo/Idh/MocA family oxidoreductase [Xanthomonas hortorum pv. pelargonii]|nr:Gfo/Idh/MocA family oxidoreductase [Xanthomonas hortorum pv. pelargonii]
MLIAGAKFGEMYLNAFLRDQPGLELAGLLATGSARAQQLAHAFGIPLYTAIEQLPDDIDIACVVVRSTVVGGTGTALAEAFLRRGMHVIQEHPMHPDDAARLQALAHAQGRAYWISSYYAHTPAGACWIDRARRVRQLLDGEAAHFAQLTTSRQLLYSSLDLLLQACQVSGSAEDVAVEATADQDRGLPAAAVESGAVPGVAAPADLSGPAGSGPAQPGHAPAHAGLAVRLSVAGSQSRTGAVDSGAVRPTPPRQRPQSVPARTTRTRIHSARPATQVLHPAPPDWRHSLEIDGPTGVGRVLQLLGQHLDGAALPPAFDPAYQLALATLWQQVLRCAGPAHAREPARAASARPARPGHAGPRRTDRGSMTHGGRLRTLVTGPDPALHVVLCPFAGGQRRGLPQLARHRRRRAAGVPGDLSRPRPSPARGVQHGHRYARRRPGRSACRSTDRPAARSARRPQHGGSGSRSRPVRCWNGRGNRRPAWRCPVATRPTYAGDGCSAHWTTAPS